MAPLCCSPALLFVVAVSFCHSFLPLSPLRSLVSPSPRFSLPLLHLSLGWLLGFAAFASLPILLAVAVSVVFVISLVLHSLNACHSSHFLVAARPVGAFALLSLAAAFALVCVVHAFCLLLLPLVAFFAFLSPLRAPVMEMLPS